MTERRRFNRSERVALWLAADGRCESCGVELDKGWHADHVHPYSEGGPTWVGNGAALCPTCNHKKGASSMTDPRDIWQRDAVSEFLASTHDYLITATPGAGKTRAALMAARELFDAGMIDRLIIVAPSDHLRTQWSTAAAGFGIDVTARYQNADGPLRSAEHGAVVTYAQVAAQPDLWARHTTRGSQTLVVLDEVHHAGEQASWGKAIRDAFTHAYRRLMLSGTPFRSDATAIPFVRYDDNGMSIADFPYLYGRALADSVVRPIRFEVLDGNATWRDVSAARTESLRLANATDDRDIANALRTVIDPAGDWIASVLRRADAELTRTREETPDAGGLVLAPSINAANRYAQMMTRICGEPVFVAHSEHNDPSAAIRSFADGRERWLVAVQMVSEGVDIPRLAVGVYASQVRTELWFRQVVGRFVRTRGAEDFTTATLLIPQIAPLVEMAERIDQEVQAALREAEEEGRKRAATEGRTLTLNLVEPVASSAAVLSQAILTGETFSDAELTLASDVARRAGIRNMHPADVARIMRAAGMAGPVQTVATVQIPPTPVTADQQRTALRRQLARLVAQYAASSGHEHKAVHVALNRACGDTVPTASLDTLRKRIDMVTAWRQK